MEAPSVAPGKRAFDSPHALCGLALHRQLPRGINEIMIFNVHFQMEKQTLKINFYQFLALFVSSVELKMGRSAKTLHSNYNESVASGCINMTPMTQWHAVENKQTQFNL